MGARSFDPPPQWNFRPLPTVVMATHPETWSAAMARIASTTALFATLYAAVLLMKFA